MFCPRCRIYSNLPSPTLDAPNTNAPQANLTDAADQASAAVLEPEKPSAPREALRCASKSQRCAACGTLMTVDRLAAEFPERRGSEASDPPPPARAAAATVGEGLAAGELGASSAPDRMMTVEEILRETAGPNPISGVGQIPLERRQRDSGSRADRREPGSVGGRRGDDIPLVGSRYQASETARRRNMERKSQEIDADWRQSESPKIPRGFGRGRRWPRVNLEAALGIGTLAAVALLVASMALRVILAPENAYRAGQTPAAHVVNASSLGYPPSHGQVKASAAFAPASASMPQLVASTWHRVGAPTATALQPPYLFAGSMEAAAYDTLALAGGSRVSPIRVWVQHLRSAADALACLGVLVQHCRQTTAAGTAPTMALTAVRWETLVGRRTAVFDGNASATSEPGEAVWGSSRAWQSGSDVVTVSGIDAATRDAFVRDYMLSAS